MSLFANMRFLGWGVGAWGVEREWVDNNLESKVKWKFFMRILYLRDDRNDQLKSKFF